VKQEARAFPEDEEEDAEHEDDRAHPAQADHHLDRPLGDDFRAPSGHHG
jgi:hypothetical protein